jgi:hypothetical protein
MKRAGGKESMMKVGVKIRDKNTLKGNYRSKK